MSISGLQHFAFCRRQWALIYLENQWGDNVLTVSGELMHARVHSPLPAEKRGGVLVSRDMPVVSRTLRIQGKCDVVEFHKDGNGVSIFGRAGLWMPCPVEYKRGSPKSSDADRLQLCAQAMCLEEMLTCPVIETAYIFYGETKRREPVPLDEPLRDTVKSMVAEMLKYYDRNYTPRVKAFKGCGRCSLNDVCLPKQPQEGRVAAYIAGAVADTLGGTDDGTIKGADVDANKNSDAGGVFYDAMGAAGKADRGETK